MTESEKSRIDKFLWTVRLFKTRSIATEECRKGRILVNNLPAKPSHTVNTGDILTIRKPPASFTYKVLRLSNGRLPAKLVNDFLTDLTPEEEKSKMIVAKNTGQGFRSRGAGRPTKKERRTIDRFLDDFSES